MDEKLDNSSLSVKEMIDLSITDLSNYIIETMRFVVSLIMGGLLLVLIAKLINIILTTPAAVTVDETIVIKANVVEVTQIKKTIDDWSSESMITNDVPDTTTLFVRKIVKQPIKGSRRKAISVGPVMLTPNSHLKRSINAEDREERYHYDIIPPVSLDDVPVNAQENVCVFVAINFSLFN